MFRLRMPIRCAHRHASLNMTVGLFWERGVWRFPVLGIAGIIPKMGIGEELFCAGDSIWTLQCVTVELVVETGAALVGRVFIWADIS
jgi:hypothetical protein